MATDSKILVVIPARGGSKGVHRKNIRPILGKPLIAYTIESAIQIRHLTHRIIVSTDDAEIADIAHQYGAEVPFMRPAELSGDNVPTLPVLQNAARFVEGQDRITLDWVLLLQPTAPLRTAEDIETALAIASQGGCDSVISVEQVFAHHPILMKRIEHGKLSPYCVEEAEGTRRQDYQPPAYMRNGAIYLTHRDVLLDRDSIWGDIIHPYVMPHERSLSIDTELDMQLAELMIRDQVHPN